LRTADQILIRFIVGGIDYELEALLSLDGFQFQFAGGFQAKIAPQRVEATRGRPQGIKHRGSNTA
jgi:hypothetical protein